jgi:toxin FitB
MIVLDTNIISEVMRPQPDKNVIAWLNQYSDGQLFITATTLAEIYYGLEILPDGLRKQNLQQRFDYFIAQGFEQKILFFDAKAAVVYAQIMGQSKRMGQPMSFADAQIAAITQVHHFSLATRNVKDFKLCLFPVLNPFIPIN